MAQFRTSSGSLNAEGWPRRSRRILSSFSARSLAFLLYDSVAMSGFVGSDLGREPVPDVLMHFYTGSGVSSVEGSMR
jgi:hypothetical protein